jgi:hypothetical protein
MPWKKSEPMDQRRDFALKALGTLNFRALCEEYGISTKTGYKWRERFLRQGGVWGATEQLWNAFHNCSVAPQTPRLITLIPLYRVPLVGLNGRKLVPGLHGFCHGAVPFLICSMSREATFLTKASLFISLTQSPLRSHERSLKESASSTNAPISFASSML